MGPGEAREVAESIGAVDNRVSGRNFGIPKHKVAVCREGIFDKDSFHLRSNDIWVSKWKLDEDLFINNG